MRVTRFNPKATRAIVARATSEAGFIHLNRIARLDECRHLTGNDPTSLYVKLNVLVDLIHPSNILTQHSHIAFALYPEN